MGNEQTALLLGTYTPKLDAKGRMALPAKMRAQLQGTVVLARGQERCIDIFPHSEFQRIAVRIQRSSMANKASRDYLRMFLSGADEQIADKQGRILIPAILRTYANLHGDVVVIGAGSRAEIWDAEAWNSYVAAREQQYADITHDVLPMMDMPFAEAEVGCDAPDGCNEYEQRNAHDGRHGRDESVVEELS